MSNNMNRDNTGGFTLVELAIAILLMAIGCVALFSSILSARHDQITYDRKQLSALYAHQLNEVLKSYVIAIPAGSAEPATDDLAQLHDSMNQFFHSANSSICGQPQYASDPCCASTQNQGPTAPNPQTACSKLPGDSCGQWALDPTASCPPGPDGLPGHDAGALLPSWFRGSPYNAALTYEVAPGAADADDRQVSIHINWTEANP